MALLLPKRCQAKHHKHTVWLHQMSDVHTWTVPNRRQPCANIWWGGTKPLDPLDLFWIDRQRTIDASSPANCCPSACTFSGCSTNACSTPSRGVCSCMGCTTKACTTKGCTTKHCNSHCWHPAGPASLPRSPTAPRWHIGWWPRCYIGCSWFGHIAGCCRRWQPVDSGRQPHHWTAHHLTWHFLADGHHRRELAPYLLRLCSSICPNKMHGMYWFHLLISNIVF